MCSTKACGAAKRTAALKPLWLAEMYRQQEERRRLQEMQLEEQQRQQQLYIPSMPREFINVRSLLDRVSNYPFNSTAEFNLQ